MRIICDLDGTLIDEKWQSYYAHCIACDQFDFLPGSIDPYWQARREGKTAYNGVENAIHRSLTRKEKKLYMKVYSKTVESPEALSRMDVFPETRQFIYDAGNIRVLTFRSNRALLELQLRRLDIRWAIHGLIACGSKKSRWHNRAQAKAKSVPKLWLKDSDDIWFIGDDYTDIEAAKILGVHSCAVCSGIRSRELLESFKPDRVIENVGEFFK